MPLSTRDSAVSEHIAKGSYPYRVHDLVEPSDQDKLSTAITTSQGPKRACGVSADRTGRVSGIRAKRNAVTDQFAAVPSWSSKASTRTEVRSAFGLRYPGTPGGLPVGDLVAGTDHLLAGWQAATTAMGILVRSDPCAGLRGKPGTASCV
jgi:hypothetical protein